MEEDELKQEKMKEYYDNSDYFNGARYNFADEKGGFNEYITRNVLKIYYPNKDEKILDIGCGWGNISIALQKEKFDMTSLDYSLEAIKLCKDTAKKLNLDSTKFICRDATNTGLESGSVDVVFCGDLVEHLYPKVYEELLRETYRILRKGGKFIIYTPNPQHIFEMFRRHNIILKKAVSHVDYKTMDRLITSLNKNDFSIKKSFYIESHIPVFNKIEKLFMSSLSIFRRRNAVLAIKN